MKIGDWTEQGYPFYSGTINYKTNLDLDDKYIGGELILFLECGEDVAEILINGNKLVLPWHPYNADITELVTTGKNNIDIKITNTLINMLEGVPKKSGILKEPEILHRYLYSISIDNG